VESQGLIGLLDGEEQREGLLDDEEPRVSSLNVEREKPRIL
jgi:hypothetical protein